ncbi:unnamed protein product [Allacma fusca]|uniref:Uncharacterized protein n=1 Tax=Allacma fusca TaxID=39272 RepID=A0A8J2KJB0_9HEXA|nr:unnamed protein product [Allacma fusca]
MVRRRLAVISIILGSICLLLCEIPGSESRNRTTVVKLLGIGNDHNSKDDTAHKHAPKGVMEEFEILLKGVSTSVEKEVDVVLDAMYRELDQTFGKSRKRKNDPLKLDQEINVANWKQMKDIPDEDIIATIIDGYNCVISQQ